MNQQWKRKEAGTIVVKITSLLLTKGRRGRLGCSDDDWNYVQNEVQIGQKGMHQIQHWRHQNVYSNACCFQREPQNREEQKSYLEKDLVVAVKNDKIIKIRYKSNRIISDTHIWFAHILSTLARRSFWYWVWCSRSARTILTIHH